MWYPHRATPGARLWRRLHPALSLWGTLLAINGIVGLSAHVFDIDSPHFHLWPTALAAIIVLVYCAADRNKLLPLLQHSGFTRATWWYPAAALAGFYVLMSVYLWMLTSLGAQSADYLGEFVAHGWPMWSAFVLISVCPGVFEELAFRGFMMGRLEEVMKPKEALLAQAMMFSVLHMTPLVFVSHFLLGLVLGLLRTRTRSLYPGIIVHMLWNAWVVVNEMMAMP